MTKSVQLKPRTKAAGAAKKTSGTSSKKTAVVKSAVSVKKKDDIKGLTLTQIINATPALIKAHARDLSIRSMKPATTKGGFPAMRARVHSERDRNTIYNVDVVGKEGDHKPLYKQKVLVSCNCQAFCFYSEFALTKWGASKIKYCDGTAPTVTNPGLLPMGCKHVIAVAREIIERKL